MKTPFEEITGEGLAPWMAYITAQLGRSPRGLSAIAALDDRGQPAVIRVASVVDNKPFPTLYWLIDPVLNLKLDRLEATGWIARLQEKVDADASLRQEMAADHIKHRRRRVQFLTPTQQTFLESHGMIAAVLERGIGGIVDPDRIRCLHTWYGAHLVESNSIGRLVDELLCQHDHNDTLVSGE